MALSKNVFYTLLSQVPQFAGSVLVSILSTRILGPEGKGAYSILFYEATFIALLLNLGINFSAVYFISSKRITAARILGIGSYHILLNFALLAAFFAAFWYTGAYPLLFPKGHINTFFLFYLVGSFGLAYVNNLFSAIYQGSKQFRRVNQSILLKAVLNTLVFAALYLVYLRQPVTLETVLWCLLLVVCWPLALLAIVLYPLIWLLLLPFRILGFAVHEILALVRGVFRLPFRILRLA